MSLAWWSVLTLQVDDPQCLERPPEPAFGHLLELVRVEVDPLERGQTVEGRLFDGFDSATSSK